MKLNFSLVFFFVFYISNAQDIALKKIDAIIESKIKETDPGLMVGIVKDGKTIYEKYYGLANLQHQVKITPKTRSNIASIAKQFTALMILDLAIDNKLSLEDDIRKYLPNLYKKVAYKIKIRHLINHTSGIRDYVELLDLKNQTWWKQVGLDNNRIIDLLEKQEDLGFQPGSKYSYSNTGYIVLTKIIENVSGETFNTYSKKFFEELGMKETSFIKRYMSVIPNKADPYTDWGYGEWFQTPMVTKTNGDGFLFTTLKDQLIYEQALQNAKRNNNVLLIKSQQPIPNSEIQTYGFGLNLSNWLGRNRKAIHHDGGTYGYNGQTVRFTKENLTIFIISNNGNLRSNLITDEIASVLLPQLEIIQEDNYDSSFYKNVTNTNIIQKIGQYYSQNEFLTRIEEEEGKIYLRQGKNLQIELIKENNNSYHFSNDTKKKLVFYENEMVLFKPSGEKLIFKKSDSPPASLADLEAYVGTYSSDELEISFELKLTDKNQLKMSFSNDDKTHNVTVYNRNDLVADNNLFLKVNRNIFDSVTGLLVTYDRAKNMLFKKKTHFQYQPKVKAGDGSIQVTTIPSKNGNTSDILLTKNYKNGNEIWFKRFGGSSYDKANSILNVEDGYIIVGSTSSYGNGNYDMFVIKTDKKGNKLWQKTYGGFYNEYGYSAEKTNVGYIIKGTKQSCENNTDIHRKCEKNVWFVTIDKNGNEINNQILEPVN